MLSRASKALFYALAEPAMWFNGWLHRNVLAPRSGPVRVHLGPGQRNYMDGWVNVDANAFTARCDIWADLRHELPFRAESVDCFYSHHVVEHLPDLRAHFLSVYGCLKPGGAYRVGGPNADSAIRKFFEQDLGWFGTFPEARRSIGGRFDNFLLCRNEHLAILTFSYVRELMEDAGFVDLALRKPRVETGFPHFFDECLGFEHESDDLCPHTLIVEGRKPESQEGNHQQPQS